jgi:hypothetical protein
LKPRQRLLAAIVVLLIAQAGLVQFVVRPRYMQDFAVQTKGGSDELPAELLFLQFFGFREVLAGILWVRADSLFDSGNYDAILPIIRMVTWLDPHYIDVFATGMWHLGYNFTDEESRSDRRYIPYALALGKEGAANNPETYEMFFETGWMWFHKIDDDYPQAIKWLTLGNERKDILPARRNLLSAAYFRNGEPQKALDWYYRLLDQAQTRFEQIGDFMARSQRDTIENNIDTTLVRMAQRGQFALNRNDGSYGRLPYDTRPPFDVGFSVRVVVEDSKVLRVEGTWGVLSIGTRVRIVLRDENLAHGQPAGMDWDYADTVSLDPPRGQTFMQDQLFVKNGKFNRRIDMSRDPMMYPFAEDSYIIDFYYNPRSAAHHIQDKFGYNGEGMTDKNYLNTEVRPGQRVIYTQFRATKDQLLRRGAWRDKTPVFQTPGFVPVSTLSSFESEIIQVPGLRAQEQPSPP